MKVYEHERTNQIVARLVTIGNAQRSVVILSWVIFLGMLFSFFGTLILGELWWLSRLLGVILGYALGLYFSSLLTVVLEWMAQMLIAQGEIITSRGELP
jgi:hypothetical protein